MSTLQSKSLPTQAEIKRLLHYDPQTGIFKRIVTSGGCTPGSVAGTFDSFGYLQIRVGGRKYLAHRLAWLYVNGEFPEWDLDHINQNKADNRISNLREATRSQNRQNCGLQKNNTSGFRGVSWNSLFKCWVARIGLNGNRKCLGYFDSAEQANEAYIAAAKEFHTHNPLVLE